MKLLHGFARLAARLVAEGHHGNEAWSAGEIGEPGDALPRAFGTRLPFPGGKVDAQLAHPAARADDETAPGDPAFDAPAGNRTHVQCRLELETLAAADTARASGCSLPACSAAANCRVVVLEGLEDREDAFPTVSVPVLSKATRRIACAVSRASASLMRMPA